MTGLTASDPEVRSVLGDGLSDCLSRTFARMDWAEDEIEKAQERHPESWDVLFHSYRLLAPSAIIEKVKPAEFVYRAHCRELLERVATGGDTRPATDAEIACMCSQASLVAPLRLPAVGLYMRVWNRAFPGQRSPWKEIDDGGHYEAIAGSEIDAAEAETRRKLTIKDRTLKAADCSGRHNSELAPSCRYYHPRAQAA